MPTGHERAGLARQRASVLQWVRRAQSQTSVTMESYRNEKRRYDHYCCHMFWVGLVIEDDVDVGSEGDIDI